MRSKCRSTLVALVATLAFCVLASASASATLPEFKSSGYPVKLEGKMSHVIFTKKWADRSSAYEKGTITGEITGPNTITAVTLTFKEHSFPNVGWNCWNAEEQKGLVLAGLKGRLGYINNKPGSKSIGLLLQPAKEPIAKCTDEFGSQEFMGVFIAAIQPLNKRVRPGERFPLTYEQVKGVQSPVFFEGEKETLPETFPLQLGYCNNFNKFMSCIPPGEWYDSTQVGLGTNASFTASRELEIIG